MSAQPLAVVTGGTQGIGLALSGRLIKLGYQVLAPYRRDEQAAAAARMRHGSALIPVRVDLRDSDMVGQLAGGWLIDYGTPHVLVNNAGVNIDRPFLSMSVEDWRTVLDTNLSAVFYLTRALAPAMLETGLDAVIVNIGATTGIRPRRDGVNYCASKAGLLQLTKCLALELAPRIRVNCLIPGMTETDELVSRFQLDDSQARHAVIEQIPQRRIGTTEEIADALEFLIGSGSRYLTGQKLIVDGGQFMW
jgi:3-oxoacyl-[acyl-carrier protein] reductase